MSSRAQRVTVASTVERFAWSEDEAPRPRASTVPTASALAAAAGTPPDRTRLAQLERDGFAAGFVQGEQAGLETGRAHGEAMFKRLTQTIEELAHLRRAMIRQTEQQMVGLALAMAKRIVRREVALDKDFALAMARVALDRLGDRSATVIRLHPEDFAAVAGRSVEEWAGAHVSVEADPTVSRGGCVVQSDLGTVDGTIEAQFDEIAKAVLVQNRDAPDPERTHAG